MRPNEELSFSKQMISPWKLLVYFTLLREINSDLMNWIKKELSCLFRIMPYPECAYKRYKVLVDFYTLLNSFSHEWVWRSDTWNILKKDCSILNRQRWCEYRDEKSARRASHHWYSAIVSINRKDWSTEARFSGLNADFLIVWLEDSKRWNEPSALILIVNLSSNHQLSNRVVRSNFICREIASQRTSWVQVWVVNFQQLSDVDNVSFP